MSSKIPDEPARIIYEYLTKEAEFPWEKSSQHIEESKELWIQFAQAILPHLPDNLRPDFLKTPIYPAGDQSGGK